MRTRLLELRPTALREAKLGNLIHQLAGEASNGEEALRLCEQLQPGVVLKPGLGPHSPSQE